MAIGTRRKPTVHHRKRQAGHHRHSKTYVKAYWPYLPMLAIVAAGVLANRAWAAAPTASAQPLTRVQVLTGDHNGAVLGILLIVTSAAFGVFIARHSLRLHRLLNRGEAFVSANPWLDIITVMVFTAGFVLTRPNGFIS